jgi:NAD(P)H-hydrate epimerase
MMRLTGIPVRQIQQNRLEIACEYSRYWNQTLVLKGPLTIIADPKGEATVIPIANSALSKGGSGDVLAGIIGGYLAQGLPPEKASMLAAWIHAKAGEIAAKQIGAEESVTPQDLIHAIPRVFLQLRE